MAGYFMGMACSNEQSHIQQAAPAAGGICLSRWIRRGARFWVVEAAEAETRLVQAAISEENWLVGRYVELTGNKVKIRGQRFDVDNPLMRNSAEKAGCILGL